MINNINFLYNLFIHILIIINQQNLLQILMMYGSGCDIRERTMQKIDK